MKATLIKGGDKKVVESGSQDAQNLFGQGYTLGSPGDLSGTLPPQDKFSLPDQSQTMSQFTTFRNLLDKTTKQSYNKKPPVKKLLEEFKNQIKAKGVLNPASAGAVIEGDTNRRIESVEDIYRNTLRTISTMEAIKLKQSENINSLMGQLASAGLMGTLTGQEFDVIMQTGVLPITTLQKINQAKLSQINKPKDKSYQFIKGEEGQPAGVFDPATGTFKPTIGKMGNYDISSYATDPTHEEKVNKIYNSIQGLNTVENIDSYIKQNAPKSPLTGEMIINTANKFNIEPEAIISLIQQDSSFGTAGKATYTFNPGNVGNDDAGNLRNYGNWQTGLDAVGDWLSKHKTETPVGLNQVDQGTLVMQLGKMIYGTRISDAEGKRIATTIDSYLKMNPNAGVADIRQELVKKFLGFDLKKNQEIGENLINSVTQFSEEGLAGFDVAGLARLLNNDKISEAISKVENSGMMQAKKIDPDGYLGEGAAKTTMSLMSKLKSYINKLDKSPIGVVEGSMQDWLGRFKGKEATKIKADIVAIVSDWRKQYAGVNVTATELEFVNAIAPALYDNPDNFMIKLDSLSNQILTKNNSTRSVVGLPEISKEQLLDKNLRVKLYSENEQTTNEVSGTTSSGLNYTIEK